MQGGSRNRVVLATTGYVGMVSTLSRLGQTGLAEPSPRVWRASRADRCAAPECAEQVEEKKKKQVQLTENFELY